MFDRFFYRISKQSLRDSTVSLFLPGEMKQIRIAFRLAFQINDFDREKRFVAGIGHQPQQFAVFCLERNLIEKLSGLLCFSSLSATLLLSASDQNPVQV